MTDNTKAKNIDEYISAFPQDVQEVLQNVRMAIQKAVPEAQETISYAIPTFTLHDKYMLYFAGYEHHISVYPIPSDESLQAQLESYVAGKGTLRFPLDQPIPYDLIAEVARAAAKDNQERTGY